MKLVRITNKHITEHFSHLGDLFILGLDHPDDLLCRCGYQWGKSVTAGTYFLLKESEYEEASDEAG